MSWEARTRQKVETYCRAHGLVRPAQVVRRGELGGLVAVKVHPPGVVEEKSLGDAQRDERWLIEQIGEDPSLDPADRNDMLTFLGGQVSQLVRLGSARSKPEKLGDLVRKKREAAGLTHRQLSARTGIHESHLRGIESNATRALSNAEIEKLAKVLDVDVQKLKDLVLAGY